MTEKRRQLFIERGNAALSKIRQINERLEDLRMEVGEDFPLDPDGVQALREKIAQQLQVIHDLEKPAVTELRSAMST